MHNRGDFDLTQHQQFSGKKLEYFDQPNNRRYTPYVVETSVGADRTTLAVLVNAYHEETVEGEDEGRTVLKLQPSLAPVKAGIFPLVKKDGMPEMAHRIADDLRPLYPVFYDESGAIGRRYRRQDEIGTPFGITVDGESMTDGTVTIRDRDTLQQDRVVRGSAARRARGAPGPMTLSLETLRREGDDFHQAISRELYASGSGLKKKTDRHANFLAPPVRAGEGEGPKIGRDCCSPARREERSSASAHFP